MSFNLVLLLSLMKCGCRVPQNLAFYPHNNLPLSFSFLDKNYTQEPSPNADGPSPQNWVVLLTHQKEKKPKQGVTLYQERFK